MRDDGSKQAARLIAELRGLLAGGASEQPAPAEAAAMIGSLTRTWSGRHDSFRDFDAARGGAIAVIRLSGPLAPGCQKPASSPGKERPGPRSGPNE